jgi:23S rRNA pseudouridine2604 synthase
MEHELMVDVAGENVSDQVHHITRALNDPRKPLPAAKVSINSTGEGRSTLRFAIKGAHPGLIAHLCQLVQLDIIAMRRIRLGRVGLRDLAAGQWRYLSGHERF